MNLSEILLNWRINYAKCEIKKHHINLSIMIYWIFDFKCDFNREKSSVNLKMVGEWMCLFLFPIEWSWTCEETPRENIIRYHPKWSNETKFRDGHGRSYGDKILQILKHVNELIPSKKKPHKLFIPNCIFRFVGQISETKYYYGIFKLQIMQIECVN